MFFRKTLKYVQTPEHCAVCLRVARQDNIPMGQIKMTELIGERVRLSVDDNGVAEVTLVRPEKVNALDAPMFRAIEAVIARLKLQQGLRSVVLRGEGRGFCGGLDKSRFAVFAEGGEDDLIPDIDARTHGLANLAQHLAMGWRELPVPVIAAMHGPVIGGGLQMALGADIRFASPDAQFSMLEINWGLVPDMGGNVLLRGLVRDDVVRELAYTGRTLVAEEAKTLGLVTRVCNDPLAEAHALALTISQSSPNAIRAAKRLCNLAQRIFDKSADDLLRAESAEQRELMGGVNQMEALRARMEKRSPHFVD